MNSFNRRASDVGLWASAGVVAAAIAAYAQTLTFGFLLDDVPLIVENSLLKSWASLPRLLATEFWSAALGPSGRFHYFRPLASLGFFLQYRAWGGTSWPYHLASVLLHAAVCGLFYLCLRRDWNAKAALASALAFAVLPIHADAVSNIASQPELLALLGMLGAWWHLGMEDPSPRAVAAGLLCFTAAACSKESALLFPAAYAAADWTLRGRRPDHASRRAVYAGFLGVLALFLLARFAVAGVAVRGGVAYFAGALPLERLLTLSRFWMGHYLLPTVAGAFQGVDFAKPRIPLSTGADGAAWACLAALLAAAALVVRGLRDRAPWAFWAALVPLFLLGTSHLLNPLDTIGAERFLYTPSLAWCAALGWAATRLPRGRSAAALGLLFVWYGGRTIARSAIWRDELSFFTASVAENPAAGAPRYSLGVALIKAGRAAEGEAALREAVRLEPGEAGAWYDLGRLAWERGDFAAAESDLDAALKLQPLDADTLTALGLLAERRGAAREAEGRFRAAVAAKPWDPRARYALGRLLALRGDREAAPHLREFLRLAPDDPLAPSARRLLGD